MVLDNGHPVINTEATAGAVYIIRNPLDVVISLSHHRGKSIDDTIEFMGFEGMRTAISEKQVYEIWGSWSEHVHSWTRTPHPAIYTMRYEDMLADPIRIFGGLARHLKMNPSPEELSTALDLSSFEKLQSEERIFGFRERPDGSSDSFFRKGQANQWQEILTPSQIDRIATDHKDQMQRWGYWPVKA